MKKIIAVLFGVLMSVAVASATGVDCWEEYTNDFNPSTVSKMKTVLGNTTIVRVKTAIRVATHLTTKEAGRAVNTIDIPINNYLTYSKNSQLGYMYFDDATAINDGIYGGQFYYKTEDGSYNTSSTSSWVLLYKASGHTIRAEIEKENSVALFVHTYCIATDGSSSSSGSNGAGGAILSAPVNFLIKATP